MVQVTIKCLDVLYINTMLLFFLANVLKESKVIDIKLYVATHSAVKSIDYLSELLIKKQMVKKVN